MVNDMNRLYVQICNFSVNTFNSKVIMHNFLSTYVLFPIFNQSKSKKTE